MPTGFSAHCGCITDQQRTGAGARLRQGSAESFCRHSFGECMDGDAFQQSISPPFYSYHFRVFHAEAQASVTVGDAGDRVSGLQRL